MHDPGLPQWGQPGHVRLVALASLAPSFKSRNAGCVKLGFNFGPRNTACYRSKAHNIIDYTTEIVGVSVTNRLTLHQCVRTP